MLNVVQISYIDLRKTVQLTRELELDVDMASL
jgi:hypothetical protein